MHPVHASSFSQSVRVIQHRSVQHAATEAGCCGWVGSILERIASAFRSAFKWVQSLFCGSSRPSSATPGSASSQPAPLSQSRVTAPSTLPETTLPPSVTPRSASPQPAPLPPSRVRSVSTGSEGTPASSIRPTSTSSEDGAAPGQSQRPIQPTRSERVPTSTFSQAGAAPGQSQRPIQPTSPIASQLPTNQQANQQGQVSIQPGSQRPTQAFSGPSSLGQSQIQPSSGITPRANEPRINPRPLSSLQQTPPVPERQNEHLNQKFIDFYLNRGWNGQNLYHHEIIDWPSDKKKKESNYMFWLFPTRSYVNSETPMLNDTIIRAFQDPSTMHPGGQAFRLQSQLFRSFNAMSSLYDLGSSRNDPFAIRLKQVWWLNSEEHHERITRILLCMSTLVGPKEPKKMLESLEAIAENQREKYISDETLETWRKAASGSHV